jgi:hypothetical protein
MRRRLSRNYPDHNKGNQSKITKMPPKGANLLEYSDEGRDILSKLSSAPLEGFATHTVDASINEFMKDATTTVEKGYLYLLWHLLNVEETLEDVAENAIIDGGYDEGIDAYLVDFEEKKIRLFQSKYGISHSIGEIDKFVQDVERLKEKDQSKLKRDELQYLWKHLKDKKMTIELVYITDQFVDDYQNDKVKVMGRCQVYETLWERIKKPAKDQNASLRILKQPLEHKDCKICVVSAFDLAELVEKNEHYIFESNIRKHLGGKGSINKKISRTLEEDPRHFFEWNNGITITADDVSIKNNELFLKGAQIVNGAQTSKSILDKKKKANNVDAEVLVTVIKTKDEEQQKRITKYRNSQNAVKGKDYVSLQDYFISIHQQIIKFNYCFEHQQGLWLNLTTSEKVKFQGNEMFNKYLPAVKDRSRIKDDSAIASFVSYFIQKPNEVYGGISKYLPNGSKYETVFNDELECDYRYFLFPHLIREFAKHQLGYDRKNTQNKNKRYAQSLFVAVTARVIHKNILRKNDDFKNDIVELEKIIQNFRLCEKILNVTDRVITKFLEDSAVESKIEESNTAHNFFSNNVYSNEMLKIIDRKISQEQNEIDYIKKTISGI